MLYALKVMFLIVLFSIFSVCGFLESSHFFVSHNDKEEARVITEKATQLIDHYKEEMSQRVRDAKTHVQRVMDDVRSFNNTTPCSPSHETQQKGCAVMNPQQHDLSAPIVKRDLPTSLIIFISFSMPDASLKALFIEAEKRSHVRLVLRGFMDDSMEKTARKIQELGGVVDIDPDIFERYHIEQVPTFLWMSDEKPKGKLCGNITLSYAQELFNEKNQNERHAS